MDIHLNYLLCQVGQVVAGISSVTWILTMKMNSVKDVRQFFVDELNDQAFTIDKTGARTIEMIGASFIADEPAIFGKPNWDYINSEIEWYELKLPVQPR